MNFTNLVMLVWIKSDSDGLANGRVVSCRTPLDMFISPSASGFHLGCKRTNSGPLLPRDEESCDPLSPEAHSPLDYRNIAELWIAKEDRVCKSICKWVSKGIQSNTVFKSPWVISESAFPFFEKLRGFYLPKYIHHYLTTYEWIINNIEFIYLAPISYSRKRRKQVIVIQLVVLKGILKRGDMPESYGRYSGPIFYQARSHNQQALSRRTIVAPWNFDNPQYTLHR